MEPQKLQLKANDEVLKGVYSNSAQVAHSREEFIIDFFSMGQPYGLLVSRVLMSPGHTKRLLKALEENIQIYEKNLGNIVPAEKPKKNIGFTD